MAIVAGSAIVGLIVFSSPLTQRFAERTPRGRLWDFVCVSLVIALIAQSIVLFNPDALVVGAIANGTIVLVVGAVWLGCRHINGYAPGRATVSVILIAVAVALVSAPHVIEPVDASIPTSAVLLALAVAGVRQCWRGRLRQIPEARVLAAALMMGMLCAPLWVAVSHTSGTSFLEALICAVAVLTLVPIAGVAMLYILAVAQRDESDKAVEAGGRIFVGAKAFQLAVLNMDDAASLAVIRMPANNDETLLKTARALEQGLGADTPVGAFNSAALVVVSVHPVDELTPRIRRVLATVALVTQVDATEYSPALLNELTRGALSSGTGFRM